MADRTMTLRFVGDINNLQKSVKDVGTEVKGFGDKAKNIGRGVVAALGTAAVVEFGRTVVESASNAEQALGAARSTFGKYSDEIVKFSKTTATQLGISQQDFLQTAAVTGSLLKAQGVPMEQLSKTTETLTKRAADLAATFGGTVPEAMDAINSALKGEFDPLERFGVSLKQSAIDAKAQALGLVDASGKATTYGRAMAAQALILEQSADKAGTFARESGTLAGQQQRMKAQFEDLTAQLGTGLLPVMTELLEVTRPLITFIAQNAGWLVPVALGIGAIVVAVKAWTFAQMALNLVLTANPIGLIIVGIAALVAAIVVLVKNWDTVTEVVGNVVEAVTGFLSDLWDTIWRMGSTVVEYLTWPYRTWWKVVTGIIGYVTDAIYALPGVINRLMTGLYDILVFPFRGAANFIGAFLQGVRDGFWALPGFINTAFHSLYDIITYPFRRAIDAIKWLWNSTLGGFGFSLPSWLPFVGGNEFRIPRLAQGGIVTRPTLVLAGEAGPEAIIPLGAGTAGAVTINLYTLNATPETGRMIVAAIREHERISGRRVLAAP